jgi:hypothetical protein
LTSHPSDDDNPLLLLLPLQYLVLSVLGLFLSPED